MIAFLPAVRLRELGKQVEVSKFNEVVRRKKFTSVEILAGSVFYRFACDKNCPALFVLVPQAGDELIADVEYLVDFPIKKLMRIAKGMFNAAVDNYGTNEIDAIEMHGNVYLFIKKDFAEGKWDNYGFEFSGKDGISIPS